MLVGKYAWNIETDPLDMWLRVFLADSEVVGSDEKHTGVVAARDDGEWRNKIKTFT